MQWTEAEDHKFEESLGNLVTPYLQKANKEKRGNVENHTNPPLRVAQHTLRSYVW